MEITHIETIPVTMRLRHPYTIAYETVSSCTNLFIRVETNAGIQGWGCAAPDPFVTGESPAGVQKSLIKVAELIRGHDPLRYIHILEMLKSEFPKQSSMLCGVDMALYDLLGRVCRIPLWRLLGGYRSSIKTSITLGIMPVDEALRQAREYVDQGFKSLKIKGGLDPAVDVERIIKIRECVGKEIELRVDLNQGYSAEQAIWFVEQSLPANIELIEQPTLKGNLAQLGKVTDQVPIPVMADESMNSLRDVFRLAQGNLVDMVNIKLAKVGGISEAMMINAVARSANLEAMVGCLDEAALSIAAGVHFALARPNVRYADLDGHLDLLDDPSLRAVCLVDGVLYPTNGVGLGFIPKL
jgi:L-alanine-DL-glutamate epimerase-like enolase superfamily enzyme